MVSIGIIASSIVLGAIILSVWAFTKSEADVTVYQVGVQNPTRYIGGGGIVFPRQQLDLSYPVAEHVISIFVKPGDEVSPNQSLIQLDPGQLNVEIQQASNDMEAAQAYLNSVSGSGNAIAIAQAQQAYNLAKNKYNALVAESSSPLLHHGILISPMSGTVTTVDVNPGEVFIADTPLLTIMDESTVIVHVKVPLSNLGQVHIGQTVLITPSALPDQSFKGSVSSIIPQADPQTDTFEVWVSVPNPDKFILPGMSVFARIQSTGTAIVVPRLAVLNPDRESEVFVLHNGSVFMQHVHIVARSITSIFIDEGLAIGDKIVLVGLDDLKNGQRVRVSHVESQG